MSIVDRLRKIVDYNGISARQFCIKVGIANGFFDKVKDVGSEKLLKVLKAFPDINAEWLLTGQGEMLKKNVLQGDTALIYKNMLAEKDAEISRLNREIGSLQTELKMAKKISVQPESVAICIDAIG